MPAPSPITADSDLATFTLKANGTDIDQSYEVLSIQVTREANRIPSARVVIRDGSAAAESFTASIASSFAAGNSIDISAGYHNDNSPLFSGIIVRVSVQQRFGAHSTFIIDCRDKAVAMTVGRKSAYFSKQTDSAIIQSVIGNYGGLSATVTSTSVQHEELTQFAATDWDFVVTRADANGMLVLVDDGTVTVAKPDFSKSPALTITYGFDLLDFNLEEDVRSQYSSVSCASWDPKTQAMITASSTIKNSNQLGSDKSTTLAQVTGGSAFQFFSSAPIEQGALTVWAEAQLTKSELAKVRGTVRFQGNATVLPGTTLSIVGLGSRFDGTAFVGSVTHRIEEGNWHTEAGVGVPPEWFSSQPDVSVPRAYGLLPAVNGLQIGTVKQIQSDPAGNFRVLVNVPAIDPAGDGIWARFVQPYATNQAGMFFYPEVGDEVVLSFIDADPRYPVVVGSLYSAARTAPFTPDEKNSTKAIVTNAQMKVIFDEEKKIITIQTPGGNSAVLSDDGKCITLTDLNGNSVKLSTDGIALSSVKDVTITASQNVSIQAQAGTLTEKGTQGVSVSGLKISHSADTEFSASGNATASLTSSGQAKIQGSIVMIN